MEPKGPNDTAEKPNMGDLEEMEEMKECLSNLDQLCSKGYTKELVSWIKEYCRKEHYDVGVIQLDMADLEDSLLMGAIMDKHNDLNDRKKDLFDKMCLVLGLNDKPSDEQRIKAAKIDYKVGEEEMEKQTKEYNKYCPTLLPPEYDEVSLINIMAVGRKNHIPLLQNLSDTCDRARIDHFVKTGDTKYTVVDFSKQYEWLQKQEEGPKEKMIASLQSFGKRICPRLQLSTLSQIDDSAYAFCDYVSSMIYQISTMIISRQALPPFQIDFMIIPRNVVSGVKKGPNSDDPHGGFGHDDDEEEEDEEDEEDDDDDDDDPDMNMDDDANASDIGDVESRLKNANLLYKSFSVPALSDGKGTKRQFHGHLKKALTLFFSDLKAKIKKEFEEKKEEFSGHLDSSGMHKKRICIVVDRRSIEDKSNDNEDDAKDDNGDKCPMFIYLPPEGCDTVVDVGDPIPESYFNASKTCLLPEDEENEKENIDVATSLGGQQFTLSFHVAAADDIKCYIFIKGQMSRFFAADMVDLWPTLFKDDGKGFSKDAEIQKQSNTLQKRLLDRHFSEWWAATAQESFGDYSKNYGFDKKM